MTDTIQELIRACKSGDFDSVRRLNDSGLNLGSYRDGETSWIHWLMLGVNTPDTVCVQILELLKPENVNQTADDLAVPGLSQIEKISSVSPLHLALHYKGVPVIKALLELGANPDAQDSNGDTCLIYASREGARDRVEILLDAGADMMISNKAGETALSLAADEVTRTSLTHKLNDKLIKAIKSKREITDLLLSRADPTCSATCETPCLSLAIQAGDYKTILELLEHSPPVDGTSTSTGNTSLHDTLTTSFDPTERLELVSELIFLKADVNAKNLAGKTPLDLASESNCCESLIKLLTDHGAELSKQPVTVGRIVRQPSANPSQPTAPLSPSGDLSPRAPDTIDLSEVAGRAGSLLSELQKAREFVGSMSGKTTSNLSTKTKEVVPIVQSTETDLINERKDLESNLVLLTANFDAMKNKNKNISDFRSIGEFLDLQKSIAECRARINQVSLLIEKGDFRTENPAPTDTSSSLATDVSVAGSAGWFRSPDSIEADIEQCIRTIRKSTNNSVNIEGAIFEFIRRASAGGGLRTNEGIPILKLLRNRGSEINFLTHNDLPFMMVCDSVSACDDEVVDWMLSNGVDLTATVGPRKWTSLFYAASRGNVRICEKILKRAAKSKLTNFAHNTDTDGKTAMDYSTNRGVSELLKSQMIQQPQEPELAAGS